MQRAVAPLASAQKSEGTTAPTRCPLPEAQGLFRPEPDAPPNQNSYERSQIDVLVPKVGPSIRLSFEASFFADAVTSARLLPFCNRLVPTVFQLSYLLIYQ